MSLSKLHIKSNLVITILAVLAIVSYLVVENTKSYRKQKSFSLKFEAAQTTHQAFNYLKNKRYGDVHFVDNINDPNETGLIGQRHSQITTGSGSLPIKLSTTNPNLSGLIVQLLLEAGIEEGDNVAVCSTGSFPTLSIATFIAIEKLKANPIVIISTTSSSWGANNPDFTILDMLDDLKKAAILNLDYEYASIGGNQDVGMSLSNVGRQLILESIERNNIKLLNKNDLLLNIDERMRIFDEKAKGKPLKVFINIGGGIASVGTDDNKNAVPSKLTKKLKIKDIPDKYGVIFEMAKRGVPVLHLANVGNLLRRYDLPINPVPLPEVGTGNQFYTYKYNLAVVIPVTFFLFVAIGVFIYIDKKLYGLGSTVISDEIDV